MNNISNHYQGLPLISPTNWDSQRQPRAQPRVQPSRKKVKCMDHNVCVYIYFYNICNDIFIINTYDILY